MRNGYGHMVHDDLVARVRALHAARAARLAALKTREQALAYRAEVLGRIRQAFTVPAPRPPQARCTGQLELACARVEKLTYESRHGALVTANLYLPRHLARPAPAALVACGHAEEGKAYPLYQAACQRLAAAGFVVLSYDPPSQGERDPYIRLAERECVAANTAAHNMLGKQLELLGDWLGSWFASDGLAALDVLLARPEVDPRHVGLTGNSGGGTMTTWLWPLDPRFTMAAPSCFVTTFLHNLENELPADCEQYPPGLLGAGLDIVDFLIARAPAPVLLLGQQHDFFDRRGLREAHQELERFNALLGAPPSHTACFCDAQPHGFSPANQRAMVSFFAQHAGLGRVDHAFEPQPVDPHDLNATVSGQVVQDGAPPLYALIGERARALALECPLHSRQALQDRVTRCLALELPTTAPYYRVLRPTVIAERHYARVALETERDVRAILYRRATAPGMAVSLDVPFSVMLYLPHEGCETELERNLPDDLAKRDDLCALDVRGMGESAPDEEGSFWQPYGMDYMCHGHELMLGGSYLGRRVYDVLSAVRLLRQEGARAVRLWGCGQGALLALFAALLDEEIAHATLQHGPRSFVEWAEAPLVAWPAANMPRGILRYADIPELLDALGGRVTVREPWDAGMMPG